MTGRTPPEQVAEGQDHLGHYIVGTGCSNLMQVAYKGKVQLRIVPLCKAFTNVLTLHMSTFCNLHCVVVFFVATQLHFVVVFFVATCTVWWCFLLLLAVCGGVFVATCTVWWCFLLLLAVCGGVFCCYLHCVVVVVAMQWQFYVVLSVVCMCVYLGQYIVQHALCGGSSMWFVHGVCVCVCVSSVCAWVVVAAEVVLLIY